MIHIIRSHCIKMFNTKSMIISTRHYGTLRIECQRNTNNVKMNESITYSAKWKSTLKMCVSWRQCFHQLFSVLLFGESNVTKTNHHFGRQLHPLGPLPLFCCSLASLRVFFPSIFSFFYRGSLKIKMMKASFAHFGYKL